MLDLDKYEPKTKDQFEAAEKGVADDLGFFVDEDDSGDLLTD